MSPIIAREIWGVREFGLEVVEVDVGLSRGVTGVTFLVLSHGMKRIGRGANLEALRWGGECGRDSRERRPLQISVYGMLRRDEGFEQDCELERLSFVRRHSEVLVDGLVCGSGYRLGLVRFLWGGL